MPSLDIVSRVDMQEVDNAVNNTKKALSQRFDFRDSQSNLELNKNELTILVTTEDQMKLEAIQSTFGQSAAKRKLELKSFKWEEPEHAAGQTLRCKVKIIEGIEQPLAKKIVKLIKETKMKVQASIQGDEVRLSGKKIDDLQEAMALLKASKEIDVPLQFVNMKR